MSTIKKSSKIILKITKSIHHECKSSRSPQRFIRNCSNLCRAHSNLLTFPATIWLFRVLPAARRALSFRRIFRTSPISIRRCAMRGICFSTTKKGAARSHAFLWNAGCRTFGNGTLFLRSESTRFAPIPAILRGAFKNTGRAIRSSSIRRSMPNAFFLKKRTTQAALPARKTFTLRFRGLCNTSGLTLPFPRSRAAAKNSSLSEAGLS